MDSNLNQRLHVPCGIWGKNTKIKYASVEVLLDYVLHTGQVTTVCFSSYMTLLFFFFSQAQAATRETSSKKPVYSG
jgi:hypothetical protein